MLLDVGQAHLGCGQAGILHPLGTPDRLAKAWPIPVGLEHGKEDKPPVCGAVDVGQRVAGPAPVRLGKLVVVDHVAAGDGRLHGPQSSGQQRCVHHRSLAGALPVKQGSGDPAGEVKTGLNVADGGPGQVDGVVVVHRHGRDGQPRARPIGDSVEAAAVRVGAARSMAGPAGIDDVGVAGADVFGVDTQPAAGRPKEIGHEDVGLIDK